MDTLATVVGIGIFFFIIIYIANSLEKEHTFWKIFTVLFILFSIPLLLKASIDPYSDCEEYSVLVTQINSTHSSYDVLSSCPINEKATPISVLNASRIFLWALSIYLILFFLWRATNGFMNMGKYVRDMFRRRP